jgi:pimeloyl-ACP methyl ester carboxylesterase
MVTLVIGEDNMESTLNNVQGFNVQREVSLTGGDLVIQEWGPESGPVIVCLHGWLDNLASFYPLADKLSRHFRLILVDLPGHGQSAPLLDGGHYYIWHNVEVLHQLLQALQLTKVHLLGHSMGGVVASLFAGAFSENVESLTLLDSLGPMVDASENSPKQLAKAILDGQRLASPLKVFPNSSAALLARKRSSPAMSNEALGPIVERNLIPVEGGYSWATDSRLRHQSKMRLSEEQVKAFFTGIDIPVLLIVAEQGILPASWLQQRKSYLSNVQQVNIPGHHHFHAELVGAEMSAKEIENFIMVSKNA